MTAKYPPTLLIHGTADTDVPYVESKNMAAKLVEAGVTHEFITVDWGRPRAVGSEAGAGGGDRPAGRRLCQDPYLIETIATLKVGDRVRVGWYCDRRKRAAKVRVIAPAPKAKAKETPSA